MNRRDFICLCGAVAIAGIMPVGCARTGNEQTGEKKMYGLIGKMRAASGKRDELIAILLEGVRDMPGCLSYVVAKDVEDADAIWITEAWDSAASHKASLSLPSVQDAIRRGKPLIAGFDQHIETEPVGGEGLPA